MESADAQSKVPRLPLGELTLRIKEQDCPAKFTVKLANPGALGVPVMFTDKLPGPFANTPEETVAVRPVTPVEVVLKALKLP